MAATAITKVAVEPFSLTEIDPSGSNGVAANADGHYFPVGQNTLLVVKITSGTTDINMTILGSNGIPPDLVVPIEATGNYVYGMMVDPAFADEEGLVHITFGAVTNLRIGIFELPV